MKGRPSFIDTLVKSVKLFVVNQCYERLHTMLFVVACCCDLPEVVG